MTTTTRPGPRTAGSSPARHVPSRSDGGRRSAGWPRPVRLAVLGVVLASLVVAAWWGLSLSRTETAAVGEPVALGAGTVAVEQVREAVDPMATMHRTNRTAGGGSASDADKFAQMGMAGMAQQSADPVPAGHVRLRVDLRLAAGDLPMQLRDDDVHLVDGRGRTYAVHTAQMGDGAVAPGMDLAATALFDVRSDATGLELVVEGAARPVGLGRTHVPH